MNINSKFLIILLLIISIILFNTTNAINKKELSRCKKKCHNKKIKLTRFCKKCLLLETKNEYKISWRGSSGSSLLLLSNSNIFHYNKIENLIVFGDSHSVVGTNLKDMTYTGKNHSGGKNWPLYLIEFNNMKLWNYAVGGSVIDEKLLEKNVWPHYDIIRQYESFYENMSKGKKFDRVWNEKNSLFAVWIGTIDIIHIYEKNVIKKVDEITTQLFNIINKMYEVGARNIFIFDAVPEYKNPYCVNNKCDNLINGYLTFKNNIIIKSKQFFGEHSDINLIFYDTVGFFEDILSNCNKYKFKDCTHAWKDTKERNLKNINDYFWINSHISDLANKYLAMDINYLLNSINNMN